MEQRFQKDADFDAQNVIPQRYPPGMTEDDAIRSIELGVDKWNAGRRETLGYEWDYVDSVRRNRGCNDNDPTTATYAAAKKSYVEGMLKAETKLKRNNEGGYYS